MNTFLGNKKVTLYTPYRRVNFINVRTFINSDLNKNPIIFITDRDQFNKTLAEKSLKCIVSTPNKFLENNLRYVESYLPELLLALSTTNTSSLLESIRILSKRKFPFDKANYSSLFLKAKAYYLFQALLFGDILTSAWKGEWKEDWYILKENETLNFYGLYNMWSWFPKLLGRLSITTEFHEEGNNIHHRLIIKMN